MSFAHFAEAKITGAIAITYTPRHCELWNMDIVPIPKYRALHIHPSQLYSSLNALLISGVLYFFWREFGEKKVGCTFGLMFVLYGIMRFLLETIRDDNPFEGAWWIIYRGGTISQNIGIYMAVIGVIAFVYCWIRPVALAKKHK